MYLLSLKQIRNEMMSKEIDDGIIRIKEEVSRASRKYREQKPSMSDKTYDKLKKVISDFDKKAKK